MPPSLQFERVAILGLGLMGGSLALALKERGLAGRITGCARTPETLATAQARGAVDGGSTDPAAAVRDADLVVLAAPVRAIISQMPAIAPHLKPGAVVTDVGSTKTAVIAAADEHLRNARFVPGHPMAGTEHEGIAAARADLYEGEVWLFTPTTATDPDALAQVRALAEAVGSRTRDLPADIHDALVAEVSHVPYLLSAALVRATAGSQRDGHRATELAGPAYRGSIRLAASNAAMWCDILSTNGDDLAVALAGFRRELDALAGLIAAGDATALRAALEETVRLRRGLSLR